jgi:hypothetical protein
MARCMPLWRVAASTRSSLPRLNLRPPESFRCAALVRRQTRDRSLPDWKDTNALVENLAWLVLQGVYPRLSCLRSAQGMFEPVGGAQGGRDQRWSCSVIASSKTARSLGVARTQAVRKTPLAVGRCSRSSETMARHAQSRAARTLEHVDPIVFDRCGDQSKAHGGLVTCAYRDASRCDPFEARRGKALVVGRRRTDASFSTVPGCTSCVTPWLTPTRANGKWYSP